MKLTPTSGVDGVTDRRGSPGNMGWVIIRNGLPIVGSSCSARLQFLAGFGLLSGAFLQLCQFFFFFFFFFFLRLMA